MRLRHSFFAMTLLCYSFLTLSWAADQIPECNGNGFTLPVNNSQILHWKRTTHNQFRERGHIQGVLSHIYSDHSGHHHFEVKIGKPSDATIEVIYNEQFGKIVVPYIGMQIEACGDYITAYESSGPYPASPDGAILHWVHMNPKEFGHQPGFLVMDGVLCGQDRPTQG